MQPKEAKRLIISYHGGGISLRVRLRVADVNKVVNIN